jgi:PAS domain S-box-containing protein
MDARFEQPSDEVKRLQRCINDLVSVLALPAVWTGCDPSHISATLVTALRSLLPLQLVYVRLAGPGNGIPIEHAWIFSTRGVSVTAHQIGVTLGPHLNRSGSNRIANPWGNGEISVLPLVLGLRGEIGVVAVASERADFPTQIETLILGVAANQASIGLHEAQLLSEQKRISEELDRRVAQRTAELAGANEELQRSRAFLAEAQRLSLTGSFSWRVATDDISWSQELYRIFGFDSAAKVTLDLISTRVHPEDLPLLDDMITRARNEAKDFEYEHRLLMPDQSVKYLHLVAHAVRDEFGRLEYIGAAQDITRRRMSEDALASARSELSHVAKITSLSTLAASIAHEINQPLAGIITNANTCLRMLAADPPNVDGARETARRTIRDGNRASEIMKRLRSLFSRKGTVREEVDLNDAAQEVITLSLNMLRKNSIVLRMSFSDNLPTVAGDRVQLQQVIQNLLQNAADSMREESSRPRELFIRTEADEDSVRLSVRDSGNGFSAQDAEKLFRAFYTTKNDGMGIGLSISRSIIENHRGRIWAESNGEAGATFSFSLPRKPHSARVPFEVMPSMTQSSPPLGGTR